MTDLSKSELRTRMAELRDAIPSAKRKTDSLLIKKRLFELPEIASARSIMFYVSFRSEVSTHSMIREALEKGLELYVPVVNKKENCLKIARLYDFESGLAVSTYGILEPKGACKFLENKESLEAVVMPGLVYDKAFNRIGYGGGFYDSLLSDLAPKTARIALCFESQFVTAVPAKEKDRKPDIILTEKETYRRL